MENLPVSVGDDAAFKPYIEDRNCFELRIDIANPLQSIVTRFSRLSSNSKNDYDKEMLLEISSLFDEIVLELKRV